MLSSLLLYYVFKSIFIDPRFVSDHFRILSLVLVFKFTYLHFFYQILIFLRSSFYKALQLADGVLVVLIWANLVLPCLIVSCLILLYLVVSSLTWSVLI